MQIHTTGKKAGTFTLNQSESNTLIKAASILRTIHTHVDVNADGAAEVMDMIVLNQQEAEQDGAQAGPTRAEPEEAA